VNDTSTAGPVTPVTINNVGEDAAQAGIKISDAGTGDITFLIPDVPTADYSYTIQNFGAGDVIDFGTTGAVFATFGTPSISNNDFGDGNLEISAVDASGTIATILLTGLAAELTGTLVIIGDVASFNTAIGADSLI
jgi:hypothetical protein